MFTKMEQQDDGKWVAKSPEGEVLFGPDVSHKVVVTAFREAYGQDVPLLSDYSGMD